eukprot:17499-Heterococcus_DN1.PRE.1
MCAYAASAHRKRHMKAPSLGKAALQSLAERQSTHSQRYVLRSDNSSVVCVQNTVQRLTGCPTVCPTVCPSICAFLLVTSAAALSTARHCSRLLAPRISSHNDSLVGLSHVRKLGIDVA